MASKNMYGWNIGLEEFIQIIPKHLLYSLGDVLLKWNYKSTNYSFKADKPIQYRTFEWTIRSKFGTGSTDCYHTLEHLTVSKQSTHTAMGP